MSWIDTAFGCALELTAYVLALLFVVSLILEASVWTVLLGGLLFSVVWIWVLEKERTDAAG